MARNPVAGLAHLPACNQSNSLPIQRRPGYEPHAVSAIGGQRREKRHAMRPSFTHGPTPIAIW